MEVAATEGDVVCMSEFAVALVNVIGTGFSVTLITFRAQRHIACAAAAMC